MINFKSKYNLDVINATYVKFLKEKKR